MKRLLALAVVAFVALGFTACEKKKAVHRKTLPNFTLEDPIGKMHKSGDLAKGGLVLVVTAPTLSNSGAQKGWDKQLTKHFEKSKSKLVFLEDMDPSDFKGTALKDMKKDFKEDEPPLLLIDHKGTVRERLGAERNKTEVLVYNDKGELVYTYKGAPSASAASEILSKLKSK